MSPISLPSPARRRSTWRACSCAATAVRVLWIVADRIAFFVHFGLNGIDGPVPHQLNDVEAFLRRVAENLERSNHFFRLQSHPLRIEQRRCVSSSTLTERAISEAADEHGQEGAAHPL